MRRRIGMLRPSIINTKSRMIIVKTVLRTKFIYAAAILWYFNPEYIKTWNSILYRILKLIFHIKTNVRKDLLFKILEIKDTNEMVTKVINKLNGKIEVNQAETYVEHLSIKVIKLKLNCLFNSRNKKQKWNCNEIINNEHIIRNWPKT